MVRVCEFLIRALYALGEKQYEIRQNSAPGAVIHPALTEDLLYKACFIISSGSCSLPLSVSKPNKNVTFNHSEIPCILSKKKKKLH
jgi:hypothetical protein